MTINDLYVVLPVLLLVLWGVLLMAADVFIPNHRKGLTALLGALGMLVGMAGAVVPLLLGGGIMPQGGVVGFGGMAIYDSFSIFLDVLFTAAGLAGIGLAYDYLKRMNMQRGEYYSLLTFSVGGMMLMGHANDLVVFFLAYELLSIPLYILAGFARRRATSQEAALKYFLLGAFSTGFILYGLAMSFGATGSTTLPVIVDAVRSGDYNQFFFLAAAALLLVGFGFKVAAVPFHAWTPDVYEGAPTPVTGFMSSATKAAGFAALMRLLLAAFPSLAADMLPVIWALAAATMLVGNIAAVTQNNIKRLLAYSSIAHAGYLLLGLTSAHNPELAGDGVAAMLFYLAAYAVTNLGAWAVVTAVEQAEGRGLLLEDYSGLGRKYPWLGVAMLIFMLSFTGIPPTLGFWGKFYLFRTAVLNGQEVLVIIALLASLISAYYYLRVVVYLFFREGEGVVRRDAWLNLIAIVSAAAVVLLALVPQQVFLAAAGAIIR